MARTSFKFRLQKLLEIREMREKMAQQELNRLRVVLEQEEKKLAQLEREEQAMIDQMTIQSGKRFDIHERYTLEFMVTKKRQEQEAQRPVIAEAERAVVAQRKVLTQCGIEVKALEKLREKKLEEHREEQLREEAIFLDDLAGQQFIRQARQRGEDDKEDALRLRDEGEAALAHESTLTGDPS